MSIIKFYIKPSFIQINANFLTEAKLYINNKTITVTMKHLVFAYASLLFNQIFLCNLS